MNICNLSVGLYDNHNTNLSIKKTKNKILTLLIPT